MQKRGGKERVIDKRSRLIKEEHGIKEVKTNCESRYKILAIDGTK